MPGSLHDLSRCRVNRWPGKSDPHHRRRIMDHDSPGILSMPPASIVTPSIFGSCAQSFTG